MQLNIYHIDAFTNHIFGGNPACVIPLTEWLPDSMLLAIAKENAVAETAFFIDTGTYFHLRWFTPDIEMDLCGHATLATAHVIKTIYNYTGNIITFNTISGQLFVHLSDDLYTLNFPSRPPVTAPLPQIISDSLNIQPQYVLKSRDYMLVYENEQQIKDIKINRPVFDRINLDPGGVIVTSQGATCDFVSRYFTPQATILEDPVTGSAHCSLIPYWSGRLKKNKLTAVQLSQRQGFLYCENKDKNVLISGNSKTYMIGKINI